MIEYNRKYKYETLCEALNLNIETGNNKRNQLKKINENYEIINKDKWYIVKRKYEDYELIETQPYFKNKAYLEPILYTLLSQAKSNILRFDMKDLLQITALVNKDYHFAKWHIEEIDSNLTQDNNGLKIFIEETEPMYKKIIKDVLKDMESRQLIEIEEIPMYAKIYTDKNNKIKTFTYEASDELGKPIFMEAKRQAMKHFDITHWEDMKILNYYEWHDAKKIIENYLKKELGVAYFYYEYKLILNKTGLDEMITNNFQEMQKSFNKYIKTKTLLSQNKKLNLIDNNNRLTYVDALIDIDNDLGLRFKK